MMCGTFLISVYTCTRVISKSSFSTLRQQCEVLTLYYMKFKYVIENHREKHKHAIFHLKKSMIELIISQLSGECFYFEHIYHVATNTIIFFLNSSRNSYSYASKLSTLG